MIVKIFAIYDSKAEVFRFPQFRNQTGVMVRDFTTAVNDEKTELNLYSEDFSLMELGTFDDKLGLVTPLKVPVNLGLAASYKKVAQDLPFRKDVIDLSNFKKKAEEIIDGGKEK